MDALRAHLREFGHIAPIGSGQIQRLAEIIEDSRLPAAVRLCCREILLQITRLNERQQVLDGHCARLSGQDDTARRLHTMPGAGAIAAPALETFAPSMDSFECGRDFAARLGLGPLQKATGGKQRPGRGHRGWVSTTSGAF